jgi:hypothetical protein
MIYGINPLDIKKINTFNKFQILYLYLEHSILVF